MGRYYNGDINGKFWLAVQPSNTADRFGVTHNEPSYITYYFSEDDLQGVEDEIKRIEESLGDKLQIITNFFSTSRSYKDDNLYDLGVTSNDVKDFADRLLGLQIKNCIIENGECTFDAEL
jgi:hypothetical protein